MPTKEEVEKFKEMVNDNWIEKLTDSFAPEIYGLKEEKEALILSLVSGSKIGDLRGDINTLLVGDPSTAKSRLLKYVGLCTRSFCFSSRFGYGCG
jgi:DNA replicative helicase MCM subunit Mcm2 (Cdc46/Mcm family)